jgi:hypothetical protein
MPWDETAIGNISQVTQNKKTTKLGEHEFIAAEPSSKTWMLGDVETDSQFLSMSNHQFSAE